ncbi:MAG: RNA methyltransferase [Candidatus Hodarchaeales archaeon]|jgi:TrmH family RNA methyltransferase
MTYIILVRPEKVSNLGSICRLIANFQAKGLILVDSRIDASDLELIMTARRAMDVFYNAQHVDTLEKALEHVSYSIATTARVATPKTPRRMALSINDVLWAQVGEKHGLVFGPESTGLLNNELDLCNMLITIPTSKDYPSLNLSHSVAILLYEIYKINLDQKIQTQDANQLYETENWQPEEDASSELLLRLLNNFDKYNGTFVEPYKQEITKQVFKNIIYRAKLNKREVGRMIGALEAWEYPWKQKNL